MEDLGVNDPPINDLPDDCLRHIFSFLPILERLEVEKVCRRWHTISKKGWNDVKTSTIGREYSDDSVHLILKRCGRFLRKLRINGSSRHPKCLAMIMEFCRLDQLEDIDIVCDDVVNVEDFIRDLREIFQRARNLEVVRIAVGLMLNSIDYLNALNRETLQILSFNDVSLWPCRNEQLSINVDNFPNLKELELCDIEISEEEMERDEGSLKGLEKLMLHSCEIPDSFFGRIRTFGNLQKLILDGNLWNCTNQHFRDIAGNCRKIRELKAIGSCRLTSDCLQYLGRMPLLEILRWEIYGSISRSNIMCLVNVRHLTLYLDDILQNRDALIELIEQSSNLEKLTLWFFDTVDKALVNNIQNSFRSGHGRKHLYLTIQDYDLFTRSEISVHPLLTILYNPAGDLYLTED